MKVFGALASRIFLSAAKSSGFDRLFRHLNLQIVSSIAGEPKNNFVRFAALGMLGIVSVLGSSSSAFAAISYIQSNSVTPTSAVSASVTYTAAQTAGNLNVVVIGHNDSYNTVQSVVDTKGNVYTLAVGPTIRSGSGTQSIYYAKNIIAASANANTVTVTFSASVGYPNVRILEYSGLDTANPFDAGVGASGSGTTTNSGSVTTTNANDLLVGGAYVEQVTTGPGSGFTQRLNPYGDIVEDRIVTATGSYSATAPQSPTGWWIMQMAAFKAATDTQAPTTPSNLTATAASSTQINLSWTASTDNVGVTNYLIERCQGASCSNFAQIATATGTTYNNTGLTASTSYSYRVRATDAANNLSSYSGTASATTQAAGDTQAPTAPSNLTATAASSSQINLSWTASTDNVGVTNYLIERCQGASCSNFAQIATATGTTYNNTGLAASTSYSYRVRATDAASNLSSYSGTASATTTSGPAISYIQSNYATPTSGASTSVTYTAAQTAGNLNVVVIGHNDSYNTVQSVVDTKGNVYTLAVGPTIRSGSGTQSIYYAKNIIAANANANTVTVTFSASVGYPDVRIAEYSGLDTSNPFDVGVGASGSGTTTNSGSVTTTNANDLLVAGNYVAQTTTGPGSGFTQRVITSPDSDILEDRIVTATGSYNATAPQTPTGWWIMQMAAFKAAAAGGGDTQAPTAPSNLTATAASSTQINLSWTTSTDNVGVTNYLIERCQGASCSNFAQIATATGTTYNNTGLTASTSYSYRVRATDAASNLSSYSGTASATTQTAADTQAPTAPSNLTATTASSTQINLSWTASTDNVGVTNYLIERCQGASCSNFAQIATATGTTYNNTGLTASTSYSYRVRATDAASNLSSYSGTASATTQAAADTQAPTTPSNLAASSVSSSQINLTWTASTDNVGVTNYLVERCQGGSCNGFAQITSLGTTTSYSSTGLSASTSYSYRVRAKDAAGNFSSYSAIAATATAASGTAVAGSIAYQYDEAGRLRRATFPTEGSKSDYTLDAAGNRTTVTSVIGGGQLNVVASAVSEAAGQIVVTVNRSVSTYGAISVNYATSDGTAKSTALDAAGADYTATSGTLNWADGDAASKTFSIPINNDAYYETSETLIVTLSNPTVNAVLGSSYQATIAINNDDAAPSFAINSTSVSESNGTATLTVTRTGLTTLAQSVNYSTADNTAVVGSDYTATSGTLSFAPSDTSKTITVAIANDAIYENNDNINVNLSSPTNGAIVATGAGTITIMNDDPAPSFSIAGNWNYENGGSIVFTVTKTGSTALTHSESYCTGAVSPCREAWGEWAGNGYATGGIDYVSTVGTLTFAPNETTKTIAVSLINDDIPEPAEYFYVALYNATGGATIDGTYWYAAGGIADDEWQDTVTVTPISSYYFDSYQSAVYYGAYDTSGFSPTQMTGGAIYKSWYEWTTWYNSGGSFGPVNWLAIQIPYNPGKNWLISIAVSGVTNTGASAYDYYYNPATHIAEWYWYGNIFSTANPVATVIHH